MLFCPDCKSILITQTDTGQVIKYCSRCAKEFNGDPEDTLITSSFSDPVGYNTDLILKYAPYDRVNQLVKLDCRTPGCGRKYMTKVFLNNVVYYVCDNCPIQLSGKDVVIDV